MELAATAFEVGVTRLFIALLRPHEDGADTFEVALPLVRVKRQGVHESVGAVANLADRQRRVFPPAAAGFGGPGTDG
jgi:hypothetical protein